jgi:hypothetical protein
VKVSVEIHPLATLLPIHVGKRLSGPQSRFGHGGEKKNPCLFRESNPVVQPVTLKDELYHFEGLVYLLANLIDFSDVRLCQCPKGLS